MKWKKGLASALCVLLLLEGSSGVSLAEGISVGMQAKMESKTTETSLRATDSEMDEELSPDVDEDQETTPDFDVDEKEDLIPDSDAGKDNSSNADQKKDEITVPDIDNNIITDDETGEEEKEESLPEEEELVQEELSLLSAATPSDAVYVSNENELRQAMGTSGTIIVDGEIELSGEEPLVFRDTEVSLQGGKIVGNGGEDLDGGLIVVDAGAVLELEDIELDMTNLTMETNGIYVTGSLRINDGTEIICTEQKEQNYDVSGVWIRGKCTMSGGRISGFPGGGVHTDDRKGSGTFILEGGEISGNSNWSDPDNGGDGINNGGNVIMNGGLITGNKAGLFNGGNATINGGEIRDNEIGIFNNDRDNMTGETYTSQLYLNGGEISENEDCAILNSNDGTVYMKDGTVIEGIQVLENAVYAMATRSNDSQAVVVNEENASFHMDGGSISAYGENEIAFVNDDTGKLEMKGGEIIAAGNQSVALYNTNATKNSVVIAGGSLKASGTGSKAVENSGSIEYSKDVEIEAAGQFLVSVNSGEGGTVSPTTGVFDAGQTVTFSITPNSGYRINDVKVDGTSIGAVSSYKLTVAANHIIEVSFAQKTTSGGSSGGSSGGGGRSSSGSKSTSTGTIIIDAKKGPVNSLTGIVTGTESGYSKWIQEVPETQTEGTEPRWKLQYADGTWATGVMVTDAAGNVNEQPAWEMINGSWYVFGADGYAKSGFVIDPALNGIFYVDINSGMKTGWQQVNEAWYYFNEVSDGTKGKMLTNAWKDGHYVNEQGVRVS